MIGMAASMAMEGASKALNNMSFAPQDKLNAEFLARNTDIAKELQASQEGSANTAQIASQFGPIGKLAGAMTTSGQKLLASAQDEYGVQDMRSWRTYTGAFLNPINFTMTMLKQKGRKEAADEFEAQKIMDQRVDNTAMGAQIENSIPQYQAPKYGRMGMKIRSKFSM